MLRKNKGGRSNILFEYLDCNIIKMNRTYYLGVESIKGEFLGFLCWKGDLNIAVQKFDEWINESFERYGQRIKPIKKIKK